MSLEVNSDVMGNELKKGPTKEDIINGVAKYLHAEFPEEPIDKIEKFATYAVNLVNEEAKKHGGLNDESFRSIKTRLREYRT